MKRNRPTVDTEIHTCRTCGAAAHTSMLIGDERQHYCAEHAVAAFTAAKNAHNVAMAQWHQDNVARGAAYWQSRGIAVGDEMQAHAVDMLTGGLLGSATYRGIACISKRVGAYVRCKTYPGMLDPDFWQPVKAQQSAHAQRDEVELMLANREF